MSNTFIYEQGWLVEKPERVMPQDYAAYCALDGASFQLGQSERDYNACVEYEKYLATLRRFKYDYPDPKKEMELGKDFELKLFDDGSWQGECIAIKKEDKIPIPVSRRRLKK